MINEPVIYSLIADWCVNLSAGWFGAALIVPVTDSDNPINWPITVSNIIIALVLLGIALILKIDTGI